MLKTKSYQKITLCYFFAFLTSAQFAFCNGLPSFSFYNWLPKEASSFKEARIQNYKAIKESYPNFGEMPQGVWLKIPLKKALNPEETYTFTTRGVDSLSFYLYSEGSGLIQEKHTGAHYNPYTSNRPSPYTTFDFEVKKASDMYLFIYAKNVNYKLSLAPFLLDTKQNITKFIDIRYRLQSFYIGSMGILLLFGLALFLIFRNTLYLFYAFCVCLSLLMMLINYEYFYLIFEEIPEVVRNKNIYGYITTLLPLNYFLFARKFLVYPEKIGKRMDVIQPYIVGITLSVLVIFAVSRLSFFEYRNIIEPIIFILILGPILLMISSIRMGYKPAWLFLVATMPVLFMGVMESLSDFHDYPVQLMHTYYYVCTFFELFILTIGLSIKFKNFQEERNVAFERMVTQEITVREEERSRIANDLHDRLGSMLATISLQLNIFKDKIANSNDASSLDKTLELLDESTKTTRVISHNYKSSSLLKLGVVDALKDRYDQTSNPGIYINNSSYNRRLSDKKENALFDIIQEAVTNVLKHAQATEVIIDFTDSNGNIEVSIFDDGIGFDLTNFKPGLGIQSLEYRVKEYLSGTVKYRTEPGAGTKISIFFVADG